MDEQHILKTKKDLLLAKLESEAKNAALTSAIALLAKASGTDIKLLGEVMQKAYNAEWDRNLSAMEDKDPALAAELDPRPPFPGIPPGES